MDVPFVNVRPMVPDEFRLDQTAAETASAALIINHCAEVVVSESIISDVWFLEFSAFVQPRNESWSDTPANRYLLDLRMSHTIPLAWLEDNGMEAELAEFAVENTTLPDGEVVQEWLVENPTSSFLHKGMDSKFGTSSISNIVTLWFGQAPYHRIVEEYSYGLDSPPHTLDTETSGESAANRAMGSRWPVIQSTVRSQDNAWTIGEITYE